MENQLKKGCKTFSFPKIIIAIAVLLIAVLTFNFVMYKPVVASAATPKKYVSDVKIVSCNSTNIEDVRRKLNLENYILDERYNFSDEFETYDNNGNHNGYAPYEDRQYLAYKTTTDPRNAITDISAMNMKGQYSFTDANNLIDAQKKAIEKLSDKLKKGLKLFRANYEAELPSAKYAYKMLNYYKEDESKKLMGDYLLTVNLEDDTLINVLVQAQSVILDQINLLVAIGCTTVAEEEDWLTKLSALSEQQIEDRKVMPQLYTDASDLYETIEYSYKNYINYDNYLKDVKSEFGDKWYDETIPAEKAVYDSIFSYYFSTAEEDYSIFADMEAKYTVLATLPYSDSNITNGYSPLGEFKDAHEGKGALVNMFLNFEDLLRSDLCAMASVFTEEQLAMIYLVGLEPFITSVSNDKKIWADAENEVDKAIKYDYDNPSKKPAITSIYTGVDRSLFNTVINDGIALTDEASRKQFTDPTETWYFGNIPFEAEIALYAIIGVGALGMIGGAAYSYAKSGKLFTSYDTKCDPIDNKISKMTKQGRNIKNAIKKNPKAKYTYVTQKNTAGTWARWKRGDIRPCTSNFLGGAVFLGAMFLVMVATLALLISEAVVYYEKSYTAKPKIIYNNFTNKKDQSVFVRYDAVTDLNGEMSDVNVNSSRPRQWVLLYTTKNLAAGNPILADSFLLTRSAEASTAGRTAVKRIGEKSKYNLHVDSNAYPLYFSYKQDAAAYPKTASTFSAGAFTLALCGSLIAGGALGWLATYLIIRKKRKNKMLQSTSAQNAGGDGK